MNDVQKILKQYREWLRGVRTDRLIGADNKQTEQAIQALITKAYQQGYIDGGIAALTNEVTA